MYVKFDSHFGTQEGRVIEGSVFFPEKVQTVGGTIYKRVFGNFFVME